MINFPGEIQKVMSSIASSSSRLLAYGIFISCVIEHDGFDTRNEKIIVVTPKENLTDDSLIHKMENYQTTLDYESDEAYDDEQN
ncbi:hypothetical protein Lal_00042324 [Lupinus albus]|nr:hypothetical protein Lal_00042324 [Lupinus albus]